MLRKRVESNHRTRLTVAETWPRCPAPTFAFPSGSFQWIFFEASTKTSSFSFILTCNNAKYPTSAEAARWLSLKRILPNSNQLGVSQLQAMANKCVHQGCNKVYTDPDEVCRYHPGPPIFHEGQKGIRGHPRPKPSGAQG